MISLSNGVSIMKQTILSFLVEFSSSTSFPSDIYDVKQQLFQYLRLSRDMIQSDRYLTPAPSRSQSMHIYILFKPPYRDSQSTAQMIERISNMIEAGKSVKLGKHACIFKDAWDSHIHSMPHSSSIWIRELPSKWFNLSNDEEVSETHELRQVLVSKYGEIGAMASIESENQALCRDICIKFAQLSSAERFVEEYYPSLQQSAIIRRDGLETIFFFLIDYDTSNYLSNEKIDARKRRLDEALAKKEELMQDIQRSTANQQLIDDRLAEFKAESVVDELIASNPDLSSEHDALKAMLIELMHRCSAANLDLASSDTSILSSHSKQLRSLSRKLSNSYEAFLNRVKTMKQRHEEQVRQAEAHQRHELLSSMMPSYEETCRQSLSRIDTIREYISKYHWEGLEEVLSLSAWQQASRTLYKILEQRQEGSQRYLDILTKAHELVKEKTIATTPIYQAVEALALFREYLNKIHLSASDSASTATELVSCFRALRASMLACSDAYVEETVQKMCSSSSEAAEGALVKESSLLAMAESLQLIEDLVRSSFELTSLEEEAKKQMDLSSFEAHHHRVRSLIATAKDLLVVGPEDADAVKVKKVKQQLAGIQSNVKKAIYLFRDDVASAQRAQEEAIAIAAAIQQQQAAITAENEHKLSRKRSQELCEDEEELIASSHSHHRYEAKAITDPSEEENYLYQPEWLLMGSQNEAQTSSSSTAPSKKRLQSHLHVPSSSRSSNILQSQPAVRLTAAVFKITIKNDNTDTMKSKEILLKEKLLKQKRQ
jgi:hypothetical protein